MNSSSGLPVVPVAGPVAATPVAPGHFAAPAATERCRVALTIPGAVALGAYEAGALAALINALRGLRESGRADIDIDVIGASSSGSLTALLAARCLLEGLDAVRTLSKAWVNQASVSRLIGHGFGAPLSVETLRADALVLLDEGATCGPRYEVQCAPITLSLAVENLRGMAYKKDFVHPRSYSTISHLDWREHTISRKMTVAELVEPEHRSVLDDVLASAANELAFPAQLLSLTFDDKRYEGLVNKSDNGDYWCADAAILDREPIGRSLRVARDIDANFADGVTRKHLVIEPQPRSAGTGLEWADPRERPTWLKVLTRTLAITEEQTVFDDIGEIEDRNDRLAAVDQLMQRLDPALNALPQVAADSLLTALNSSHTTLSDAMRSAVATAAKVESKAHITLGVISPDLVPLDSGTVNARLAGEFLFRFGGLLDEPLRQSDFDLGYKSTLSWLEYDPKPEPADGPAATGPGSRPNPTTTAPAGAAEEPALGLDKDLRAIAVAAARSAYPDADRIVGGWIPPTLSFRGRLRMLRFAWRLVVVGVHDVYVAWRDRRRLHAAARWSSAPDKG